MIRYLIPMLFALVWVALRALLPIRELETTGLLTLLDELFALIFLLWVSTLALTLGSACLRYLRLNLTSPLEAGIFGLAIGLGIIASGVMALGMVGILSKETIMIWLFLLGILAWPEFKTVFERYKSVKPRLFVLWQSAFSRQRIVLRFGLILAGLALIPALAPPYDYDGLMYHLVAPRIFLEEGRIVLLPELWQANSPMLCQMLFAVGLAFDSGIFAKLVNYLFTILFVLMTYAFALRFSRRRIAWWAVAILIFTPPLGSWAGWAGVDIAWATYQFLALYALLIWREQQQGAWLGLAGMMGGFAIGVKLLAVGGVGVLAIWIIWRFRATVWYGLGHALVFGGVALVCSFPWFLKNFLLSGNPVYPFVFGGESWDAQRLGMLMTYLQSFGVGKSPWDYLLLPINLLIQYRAFNTFPLEMISLAAFLCLLYPWVKHTRTLNSMAWIGLSWFGIWALGSQQTRFLLPLFPLMSILGAAVSVSLTAFGRLRLFRRALAISFITGMAIATFINVGTEVLTTWKVVFGLESASAFFRQLPGSYGSIEFVVSRLPKEARVLMMWDGKGFYCDQRCLPDADQDRWTLMTSDNDLPQVTERLQQMGITHLLIDEDYEFILEHDPTGAHQKAYEFFSQVYRPACTREVYTDEWTTVFELTCH